MKPADSLKLTQMVHLATVDGECPRLRPMTMIWYDKAFFFATSAGDNKARHLQENPNAEWCLLLPGDNCTGYLKGSGILQKVDDARLRKAVADKARFLYDYWQSPTDPDFVLYRMQVQSLRLMPPGAMYEEDVSSEL